MGLPVSALPSFRVDLNKPCDELSFELLDDVSLCRVDSPSEVQVDENPPPLPCQSQCTAFHAARAGALALSEEERKIFGIECRSRFRPRPHPRLRLILDDPL